MHTIDDTTITGGRGEGGILTPEVEVV